MNVKGLELEGVDVRPLPRSLVVEMTIEEALWIFGIAGQTRNDAIADEIYLKLDNAAFAVYWDGGYREARRMYPNLKIPTIQPSVAGRWKNGLDEIGRSVREDVLRVIAAPDFRAEVLYSDEDGEWLWVVRQAGSDFWIAAFSDKESAVALCREMGWSFTEMPENG